MKRNAFFFGATAAIVAFQALFVSAGAVEVVMDAWPFTVIAMAAIGGLFAFANRHDLRVGRFVAIPTTITAVGSILLTSAAWWQVSATVGLTSLAFWRGVAAVFASFLPFATVVVCLAELLFWYDWGFDWVLLKPEITCGHCWREIPRCVDDAQYCPYCGDALHR